MKDEKLNMVTLYIDSRDNKNTIVSIIDNGKKISLNSSKTHAQTILPLIKELINQNNLSIKDIDKIAVEPGPGSFTGVRVGVAIANALSFSLLKTVNGKNFGFFETPVYL